MTKTILITGSTDGIGFETAKSLAAQGHTLLIHGRNSAKLDKVEQVLSKLNGAGRIERYEADLADMAEVEALATSVKAKHERLDVLINNAGVYKTPHPRTADGMDIRFMVNTLAPYRLTERLLPIIPETGRVVNLSSAAQAPVNIKALGGAVELGDMPAYAQSKLAITMWTRAMATAHPEGPLFVAVNPGSLLATKMVKEGWGMSGNDIGIGADILVRAALSDEFNGHSGDYFDNDAGHFAPPHADALNDTKTAAVVKAIQTALATL